MSKRYDITTSSTYTKDGVEKTKWNQIGKLIEYENDGETRRFIELFMFPNTRFSVFEEKARNEGKKAQDDTMVAVDVSDAPEGEITPNKPISDDIQYPVEEVNPNDIPF